MKQDQKMGFSKFLKIIFWSFGLAFKYSKKYTLIFLFTSPILSIRSLVYSYLFAGIIDGAIKIAANTGATINDIIKNIALIFVFEIFYILVKSLNRVALRKLKFLGRVYQREYIFTKSFELGLQTIQDPSVNKLRENGTSWLPMVDELNEKIVNMFSDIVLFVISTVIIFKIVPLLLPAFLIYSVILVLIEKRFFKKEFHWQTSDRNTESKSKYYSMAGRISDPTYIEEISVLGSFNFLAQKFRNFFDKYNLGLFKIIDQRVVYGMLLDVLDTGLIFWGYIQTFKLLIEGRISVGETTFYMSSIEGFERSLGNLSYLVVSLNDFVTKLEQSYEFFNLEPISKDGEIVLPRLDNPPSIEFKNLSFTYPNTKNRIFDNFNLKIESGEKIAIVGANGAGKSTLTKLIARLYDPQKGELLINGNNLRELKIDDWYKNLGLLFQDYITYDMLSIEENIYMGNTNKPIDREKIIESAKNADAHEFITKYPKKYKTIMSERYEGGVQPSKGQRQKVSIARFFYRNAPLLIFDEPTSAIDAESEYRIFNRIYDFFKNKTVIIISHRFSTVRNADRIIVLDEGRLVEEGSHEELIKMNGQYAKAFRLQADGYR